jgi:hypothetical protein
MLRYGGEAGRNDIILCGRLPPMKLMLLAAIRIYWLLWGEERRRSCVFRESCSHYVYRVAENDGFLAGIRALRARMRACRPGYTVTVSDGSIGVRCVDGSMLYDSEIADSILRTSGPQPAARMALPRGKKPSFASRPPPRRIANHGL